MIDSVPLIQNANDAQQINASIIAMKKASRELDEKILKLNNLNKELDKKIAVIDSGLAQEITDREDADSAEVTNRNNAITNAVNALDVASVGGSGKYISAISETDGKISATASDLATSVSSGNSQPVTSGGVAEAIDGVLKNQKTYHFSSPDHTGYILMQDVSNWYNSTSSSITQAWQMNGMLVAQRPGGNDRSEVVDFTLSVGYFRNNHSLPNEEIVNINSFSTSGFVQACLVQYDSKQYLALKITKAQSREYYFIGYTKTEPLFTIINDEVSVTELYNGGRTPTDTLTLGSKDLISSGTVYSAIQNMYGVSFGADAQTKTMTLEKGVYLFICNLHPLVNAGGLYFITVNNTPTYNRVRTLINDSSITLSIDSDNLLTITSTTMFKGILIKIGNYSIVG